MEVRRTEERRGEGKVGKVEGVTEKEKRRENKITTYTPTVIHSHSISSFYTNNSRIKLNVHGSSDRI